MMKRPANCSFFLIVTISVVFEWRKLLTTFSLASRDDQYTHILLVLPIAATLIYLDWKPATAKQEPRSFFGVFLLGLAAVTLGLSKLLSASATSDVWLSIGMLALVIWWIGAFVFCFGIQVSRSLMFPLCFLFGLVPLPKIVLDRIVVLLQQGSAIAASLLFATVGVPVDHNGVFLTVPGLSIEIAKECSSIRSSSMLLVTTMVLAQLLLISPWRKALVIALAGPLSLVKNGLRIFTIAMLGTRVDPGFLNGRLHHQGGIVFFLISLVVICGVIWLLQRGEKPVDTFQANAGVKRRQFLTGNAQL